MSKTKAATIQVLVKEVGKPPEKQTIDNSLEGMQGVVGGYIEHLRLEKGYDLYSDEDGKMKQKPVNFRLLAPPAIHTFVGTVFITKGTRGLTDEEFADAARRFFTS